MPELRRQCPEAEVKMLHVGSWKEPQENIVNEHDGFSSYDISYYKTWNLYKVLKKERPDVLVMLNIYFLTDKAIITFCKKLGIKTVFLAHGQFGLANDYNVYAKINAEIKKNILSKIRKDTVITLANYWVASLYQKKILRFFKTIVSVMKDPLSMTLHTKYSEELSADEILVYFERDKKTLVDIRKFPEEKITVVGNPELDDFVNSNIIPERDFREQIGIGDNPYLLYLDDGYVQAGRLNKEDWENHLSEINALANAAGLRLIIKLHPRTQKTDFIEFLDHEDIKAFNKGIDFKSLIYYSSLVTSLMSTTISLALFLKKRILSPRWGITKHIGKDYPETDIHYCGDASEFMEWLNNDEPTVTDRDELDNNFKNCDGQSIKRIVDKITELGELREL